MVSEKYDEVIKAGIKLLRWCGPDLIQFMMQNDYIQQWKELEKFKTTAVEILKYFECEGCGECCKICDVSLGEEDIERLYQKEGDSLFDKFDENMVNDYLKAPCAFLNDECECSVYDIRPEICSIFPFTIWSYPPALVLCPLGNKIFKEFMIFVKIKGIPIPEPTKEEQALFQKKKDIEAGIFNKFTFNGLEKSMKGSFVCINPDILAKFLKYLKNQKRPYIERIKEMEGDKKK